MREESVGAAPRALAGRWHATIALAVTAVVLTAVYVWSYHSALGAFFYLDDYWGLTETQDIHIASVFDIAQLFRPFPSFLLYRPVSTLTYSYLLATAFGHDPFAYHAAHLALHICNAVLVYVVSRRLLRSTGGGIVTSLLYAMAPGHALAVYWIALSTMSVTAFFYFATLAAWFCMEGRWRKPVSLLLCLLTVLASEHVASLPLTLTAAAVLLDGRRDWLGLAREQWAFYFMVAVSVAAKLYYMHFLAPMVADAYHLAFLPVNILQQLGRYLGYALDLAFDVRRSDDAAFVLGVCVLATTIAATAYALFGRHVSRPWRTVAFGLDVFCVALGPVIFLPTHQMSYYVGIAGFGLALALVALTRAVHGGTRSRALAVALAAAVLATHVLSANARILESDEFRLFDGGSESAANWLYTVWFRASVGATSEVVIPKDPVTERVFGSGAAYKLLLCPSYEVRLSQNMDQEAPGPGRIVIDKPWALPETRSADRSWNWLRLACPYCETCAGGRCAPACFRVAMIREAHRAMLRDPAAPSRPLDGDGDGR